MTISAISSSDYSINRLIAAASGGSVGPSSCTTCEGDSSAIDAIRKGPSGKFELSESDRVAVEKSIQDTALALTGDRQSPDAGAQASATAGAFAQLAKSLATPPPGRFVDAFA